jgi:hypothetical protein
VTADLPSRCIVDARQLKRYNLSERALPEGCEVRLSNLPSLPCTGRRCWFSSAGRADSATPRWYSIAGGALRSTARRRSAPVAARRPTAVAELTAAIAHDQPAAGCHLSKRRRCGNDDADGRLDWDELQILGDIRRDDLRASEVIKRPRAFLTQEVRVAPCNMNQIAQHASAFLGAEAGGAATRSNTNCMRITPLCSATRSSCNR